MPRLVLPVGFTVLTLVLSSMFARPNCTPNPEVSAGCPCAQADGTASDSTPCEKLLQNGVFDTYQLDRSEALTTSMKRLFLRDDFREQLKNRSYGGSVEIPGVVTLTGSSSAGDFERFRNSVREMSDTRFAQFVSTASLQRIVSRELVEKYLDCLKLRGAVTYSVTPVGELAVVTVMRNDKSSDAQRFVESVTRAKVQFLGEERLRRGRLLTRTGIVQLVRRDPTIAGLITVVVKDSDTIHISIPPLKDKEPVLDPTKGLTITLKRFAVSSIDPETRGPEPWQLWMQVDRSPNLVIAEGSWDPTGPNGAVATKLAQQANFDNLVGRTLYFKVMPDQRELVVRGNAWFSRQGVINTMADPVRFAIRLKKIGGKWELPETDRPLFDVNNAPFVDGAGKPLVTGQVYYSVEADRD